MADCTTMPRVSTVRSVGTAFGVGTRSTRARCTRSGEIVASSSAVNMSMAVCGVPANAAETIGHPTVVGVALFFSIAEFAHTQRAASLVQLAGFPVREIPAARCDVNVSVVVDWADHVASLSDLVMKHLFAVRALHPHPADLRQDAARRPLVDWVPKGAHQ